MSCSGCRVLRKGCSEDCVLRESIEWIESPKAQANATLFVAKFFGRAALMSFISSVPRNQRPSLFQSLLYEAVGRIVNPVNGAVGLLWTGNWHLNQTAVETVLCGGVIEPLPEIQQRGMLFGRQESNAKDINSSSGSLKTMNNTIMRSDDGHISTKKAKCKATDLNLSLMYVPEENQLTEASTSVESETTTVGSSGSRNNEQFQLQKQTGRLKMLRLFV